jgi:hypothetical protein
MRRVRLTEGQLHNVIRESVNKILNEIDWRTYDNARLKRLKNGQDSLPLETAKMDALRRKYPHYYEAIKHTFVSSQMPPEAQKEYSDFHKDYDHQVNGDYKYEKGGRGYYMDDED